MSRLYHDKSLKCFAFRPTRHPPDFTYVQRTVPEMSGNAVASYSRREMAPGLGQ